MEDVELYQWPSPRNLRRGLGPTPLLELRPEPGIDPVLALRALLKVTLRRFGLRCVSARETIERNENA